MDCELVDRARRGDREAFAEIVETTFDRSFEIARRTIPSLSETLPQAPVIADVASAVIDHDLLERTFAQIKVEQRTILVLRYYLDQTQEEIAATLDLPVGTVKSRIHHALRAMRAAIDSESRPPGGSSASGELTDHFTSHQTGQVAR